MSRIYFEDLPSTNTPRNAANLNKLNNVVISSTEPNTGEEVWIKAGDNLFNKNDVKTFSGYFYSNATAISSSSVSKCFYIPITGGQSYTVFKKLGLRFNVGTTSSIPSANSTLIDNANNITEGNTSINDTITILTSGSANYLVVWYYASNADTYTEQQILNEIVIQEGTNFINKEIYTKNTNGSYEEFYNSDKNAVAISSSQPSEGAVWFQKGKNLFGNPSFVSGDLVGNNSEKRLSSRQEVWLPVGTYTVKCEITPSFRYVVWVQNVNVPPLSSYPTYILDSGWKSSSESIYTFTISTAGWFSLGISKQNDTTLTLSDISNFKFTLEQGSAIQNKKIYTKNDNGVYEKFYDESEVGKEIYSTEETRIGTWINGKPLYRKCYEINNITTSNTDLVNISALYRDNIIRIYGFIRADNNYIYPIPMYDSSNNYSVLFYNGTYLRGRAVLGSGNISNAYAIIEYTKTTD